MPVDVSLVMSAARPKFWPRLVNSLLANECSYEVIFVGPNEPDAKLAENVHWIPATVKPAQCYEIGLRAARGELVGWTADDADYNDHSLNCPQALDILLAKYRATHRKMILAMSTYEDGNNVSECHNFFFNEPRTPRMAPFGFMNREWMLRLGGYDRNFVCGQSENDLVMRALVDGGDVMLLPEAKVYVHHAECHGDYPFRSGYDGDRQYLESCWVNEGYGTFQHATATISNHRLKDFVPFLEKDITTVNQGPAGRWA